MVVLRCSIVGHYGIHVKHNDVHIPGSPFPVDVTPDSGLVKHVSLSGLRDRGLQVRIVFVWFKSMFNVPLLPMIYTPWSTSCDS